MSQHYTLDQFASLFTPTLKAQVYDFLQDRHAHERLFSVDRGSILLLKSRFDDETDFLYLLSSYYTGEPRELSKNAEYAGVYSHALHQIADGSYYLRELCADEYSRSAIMKRFTDAVASKIVELVNNAPIPMEASAETDVSVEREREYFVKYGADKEALTCFYKGCVPSYMPYIDERKEPEAPFFVRILNHFDDAVNEYAAQYIKDNAQRISERLWQIALVAERLQALMETPGEHHLRRRIAQSIGDQKMVRIDIARDGKELCCKIEAEVLKNADSGDSYFTYRMDAPSRAAFEKTFGRSANLYAHDITRITYGKNVLYSAS